MPYVDPQAVLEAREMDLLTYLKNYEPQELVRVSGDTYCTRTHDSLKISNGKWMWWSQGFGGYNALDYLVKVRGMSFVEAVETVLGRQAVKPPVFIKNRNKDEPKTLLLPDKSTTNNKIISYLCGRGIDKEIVKDCIRKGKIFESLPYHNVVFVGFDNDNIPRYASYRSANNIRLLGDCSGSDKHYSFRLGDENRSENVHIFECAIDLLSYATLLKQQGKDYKKASLVSLAGVYSPNKDTNKIKVPVALEKYLSEHPETKKIYIHFDNDRIGKQAATALKSKLNNLYEVVISPPPSGKDFNDFLCLKNKFHSRKIIGRSEER